MPNTPRVRVIILAAQRPGVVDPLAAARGLSHKCLVPLAGRPLIAHVLQTILQYPGLKDARVSIEADMMSKIDAIVDDLASGNHAITCIVAADNLADSVLTAAAGHDGPIIITTADNALLSADALHAMCAVLAQETDVAIAMTQKSSVLAAHPDGQRRFYRFADDAYSNCNLYGVGGQRALAAVEIFRGGGQFAKKVGRIIDSFGLINLLLLRLRLVSLAQGLKRISKRIGLNITPVILADGCNAIDVDNERTYKIVEGMIAARG